MKDNFDLKGYLRKNVLLLEEESPKEVNKVKSFKVIDFHDIFYNYTGEDDITFAGLLDGWLIDNKFGGDEEAYEEDDYRSRDEILRDLSEMCEIEMRRLLK